VSDPNSSAAAANGQYILITREAYDVVGGHAAIAGSLLEDVALARAVKRSGRKIRFRYAPDAVRTRMYRNYHQLRDGWTKNLALLFPSPGRLSAKTLALWALPWALLFGPSLSPFCGTSFARFGWIVASSLAFARNYIQLRRSNFDEAMLWLSTLFGMPMFAYLLLRSKRAHATGCVAWKGRTYTDKSVLATGH
jgi:hypothetical protein